MKVRHKHLGYKCDACSTDTDDPSCRSLDIWLDQSQLASMYKSIWTCTHRCWPRFRPMLLRALLEAEI